MFGKKKKPIVDKVLVDPTFNIAEKIIAETAKLPVNLLRKLVSTLLNTAISFIFPTKKK